MRPQQQNRRMRGRNNNNNNNNNGNRKGPNPLTRSYESNGPDVKIRGSAQQIAEKYTTLARDATSSGDRVMAENYLQHAEHYNRIIAAAQAQMPIQHQQNGPRDDAGDEDMDDERDDFDGIGQPQQNYGNQDRNGQRQGGGQNYNQGGGQQNNGGGFQGGNQQYRGGGGNAGDAQERGNGSVPVNHAEAPQPVIEGMPAEIALNGEGGERQGRGEGRGEFRDRRDRKRRFDNRENRGANEGGEQSPVQARPSEQTELPAFVTGPIPRRDAPAVENVVTAAEAAGAAGNTGETVAASQAEGDAAPRRGRRPRRSARGEGEDGVQAAEAEHEPNPAPVEG